MVTCSAYSQSAEKVDFATRLIMVTNSVKLDFLELAAKSASARE